MAKTFPEINGMTLAECNAALRMGVNTVDSMKPEHKQDLLDRLDAIEERRRRLIHNGFVRGIDKRATKRNR